MTTTHLDQAAAHNLFRRLRSRLVPQRRPRRCAPAAAAPAYSRGSFATTVFVFAFTFAVGLVPVQPARPRPNIPFKGAIVEGLFDLLFFTPATMLVFSTGLILYASLFTSPEARSSSASPARATASSPRSSRPPSCSVVGVRHPRHPHLPRVRASSRACRGTSTHCYRRTCSGTSSCRVRCRRCCACCSCGTCRGTAGSCWWSWCWCWWRWAGCGGCGRCGRRGSRLHADARPRPAAPLRRAGLAGGARGRAGARRSRGAARPPRAADVHRRSLDRARLRRRDLGRGARGRRAGACGCTSPT